MISCVWWPDGVYTLGCGRRIIVMWRRCINIAAGLSLTLGIAILLLWMRSYICTDEITYRGPVYAFRVRSIDGWLCLIESRYLMSMNRWVLRLYARNAGSLLVDVPDLQLNVPFFSLFLWSSVLPFWRFLFPMLRRRASARGFEVGRAAAT
jgi:hypothetical protein